MSITTSIHAAAVLSGSLLSGTMLAFSFTTVPVVLQGTSEAAQLYRQWLRIYNAGFPALPIISATTSLTYLLLGIQKYTQQSPWRGCLFAGLITVLMIPFTWVFLVPTNNVLMKLELETYSGKQSDITQAQRLVKKWNSRHLARSFFPLLGAVVGIAGLLGSN